MYWLSFSSHTPHHSSQTPYLPWISYATQKLLLDSCKMKHSIRFYGIFSSLKQNFIACRSSKVSSCPDCIFEIHQLWQLAFSRVYSNCCCSCSFEPEILKIGQSSHKMYSNNILNCQESTIIWNACTKKSGNLLNAPRIYIVVYIYIYIFIYIHKNENENMIIKEANKVSVTVILNKSLQNKIPRNTKGWN